METSLVGCSEVLENLSVQGTWSLQGMLLPINIMQLKVICFVLLHWSVQLKDLSQRSVGQRRGGGIHNLGRLQETGRSGGDGSSPVLGGKSCSLHVCTL